MTLVISHMTLEVGHMTLVLSHMTLVLGHMTLALSHMTLEVGHMAIFNTMLKPSLDSFPPVSACLVCAVSTRAYAWPWLLKVDFLLCSVRRCLMPAS